MKLAQTIGRTILVLVLCAPGLFAQEEKRRRVAIVDFDYGSIQQWWEGTWDIGRGITDMLVDELVKDGTYSVVERRHIDTILDEQDFSASDRANPTSAAEIGRLLGVDAIVAGSITQFGVERRGFGIGGIARLTGGVVGGGVGTRKGKAAVQLTARIVDINTAEILASEEGEGKSKRSGLLLGGGGGGGSNAGAGGISMTSSDYRQTVLGEATEAAVVNLAAKLIQFADRIPERAIEVSGVVADVDGSTLILNVGTLAGVNVGDTLKILRVRRTIKDPVSGAVLREITQDVGQVRIEDVDAGSSLGTVTAGSDIQVGDLVRN